MYLCNTAGEASCSQSNLNIKKKQTPYLACKKPDWLATLAGSLGAQAGMAALLSASSIILFFNIYHKQRSLKPSSDFFFLSVINFTFSNNNNTPFRSIY